MRSGQPLKRMPFVSTKPSAGGVLPVQVAVFGLFFSFYLFAVGIPFQSSDGQVMYETARSLAFDHDFAIRGETRFLPQVITGEDGQAYSKYDPGLPLLAAPVIRWADATAKENFADRYAVAAVFVQMVPAASMALALVALYTLAERLYGKAHALFIVLVTGLGTTVWVYGALFFAEATITAALLLALLALTRRDKPAVTLASLSLGLMLLTRLNTVIYLGSLCYFLVRQTPPPRRAVIVARLMIFPILALGLLAWHNHLRFGTVLQTGYEGENFTWAVPAGIIGMLVSPGKSVFLYAPPLILSALLYPRFRRRFSTLATTLLLLTGSALIFYGAWWAWHGGWVWGARFLVPLMPLWILVWGEIPRALKWRGLGVLLFVVGFAIQILGTFTVVNWTYARAFAGSSDPDDESRYAMVHYDFAQTPLAGAWQQVHAGKWQPQALFKLQTTGLPGNWSGGMPLVLGIIFGASLMTFLYELRLSYPYRETRHV